MTAKPNLPVIFLLFANNPEEPLAKLPEEARQIGKILDESQRRGHCEVVMPHYATADDILDTFQDSRYRNRIAIFHFGGHANGYQLLLEAADGKVKAANAGGLASFLASQSGLQLVFLNACSTRDQVAGFWQAGVPAVIATDKPVPDKVAAAFAERFYKGLKEGLAIHTAFEQARSSVIMEGVSVYRDLGADAEEEGDKQLPWQMHYKRGAEAVKEWSLPLAARDPLFGLPDLPIATLPETPYRKLHYYRREDAEIFFGRGQEIRRLYDQVTAPDADPIILFCGQSGVGKSSLLAAGLLPRLESSHEVRHERRDQAAGLQGTLAKALGTAPEDDLAAAWHNLEKQIGKPLLVVLDQVEEVFTRPNRQQPDELPSFLTLLKPLFDDYNTWPRGRLILSFRKEWLAEIKKRLEECMLPRSEEFLERLGWEGIVEVVKGPCSTERLRRRYKLTIAEALPGQVADDLLDDPESPVAPVLAILLDGMWAEARKRDYQKPTFDEKLYREFKARGLSLADFLEQALVKLGEKQPDAISSGLALDLLAYHTTPLGTAEQRTLTDLEVTYQHCQEALPGLLQACQDLHLLVDLSGYSPGRPRASRLTHDTLAPQVRKRFDESDAPGQRARRILESRFSRKTEIEPSPDGQELAPLGDADLAVVLAGRAGMRTWKNYEAELVSISEVACRERQEEQARLALEREGARQRELEQAQRLADEQRARAEEAEKAAAEQSKLTRRAVAGELSTHAVMELQNRTDPSGSLALLLAREAVLTTWESDRIVTVNTDRVLRDAIAAAPPYQMTLLRNSGAVTSAAYSPDGRFIVTASGNGVARIYDAATGKVQRTLNDYGFHSATYSPDGRFIVTAGYKTACIWDAATGEKSVTLLGHNRGVRSAVYSPNGRFIVTASDDKTACIWDAVTGEALCTLSDHSDFVNSAAYSPDGQFIVTASDDGKAYIWDVVTGNVRHTLFQSDKVTSAVYSPDGRFIVTASRDRMVRIWDEDTGKMQRTLRGHSRRVRSAAYSPDGRFIVTASWDETVRIWDAGTGKELRALFGHSDAITSAAYSPDGRFIVTASADKTARIWNATDREARHALKGHSDFVDSAAYSPDGCFIVTASGDGTARIWDAATRETLRILGGRDRNGLVLSAAYSPDGCCIVTASSDRMARIWDAATGELRHTLNGHSDWVTSAAYSPDGSFIVTASRDQTARIWGATGGEEMPTLSGHRDWVTSAAYSPDGHFIVTASRDQTARIWDAATGEALRRLKGDRFTSATYSPNGRFIITNFDQMAHIWDADTGEEMFTLSGHSDLITSAAYSPDGRFIVTASADRTARIWDAITGDVRRTLIAHNDGVNSATYSPNGRFIVTASLDNTARIWFADINDLLDEATRRIQRDPPLFNTQERQRYGLVMDG